MDCDTEVDENSFRWTQHGFDRGPIVHEGFVPQGDDNSNYEVEDNESQITNGNDSYADEQMDDISGTEEDDYLHDDTPDPDNLISEDDYSVSNDDTTFVNPALTGFLSLTSI
jgi:hypothetical protein